jgi:peptidoglycan hydrolase CwlO-like protein
MRDTATEYSKEVMQQQKDLIAYISESEEALKDKKDELEHDEKVHKNAHKLEPRRKELLEY